MDVAFVETGMKTGVSVDGVIPTSQRLFGREPMAATVGNAAPQIPEARTAVPLSRTDFETVTHREISETSARRYAPG